MIGTTDLTELNKIDVFGSWMEIGMAAAVVLIGMACVFIPIIRKLRLDKSMITLKYPTSFNWDIHTRVHDLLLSRSLVTL